ncbi:MAG TPA: hypothetical protein PKE06_00115 [Flavilitoribacter sp.]|nr:hypothetical protein [Flavilitoribacter sp.]HMQ86270.1 hypothetical protein [Flavilitoribacter sp.]
MHFNQRISPEPEKPDLEALNRERRAEIRARLHPMARTILRYAAMLQDFPNHLSIHAGGVLISERPLTCFTALEMMPKGFPVTHFDMHHAEDWGFHKFDILSQRGLGHIKDAVDIIRENQGRAVDVDDVGRIKKDERVRELLRSGHCTGCFYIESPAMRGLLQKLRCDTYIHLVAASSIIRPGVARSGMMREYIRRFHDPEGFEYPHPVFREHLGETFGVMVYQEDVMKIVHHFAGLDLGESDVLRRIMTGKKFKDDTFERLREKYLENCRNRGYSDALTENIWRQIESFSGYSFCKAHSASFAVESFQSLYLKAYFPLEFMVAVINNFGGFYQTEYYVHEARMAGANIHPPCINHSRYLTAIEDREVYLGFIHLTGMERQTAHRIIARRTGGGPFRSLADFVRRVPIAQEQLELLIRIGAFRFTGRSKYELMWEKNAVFNPKEGYEATPDLFPEAYDYILPPNTAQPQPDMEQNQPDAEQHQNTPPSPSLHEGPHDQAFDEIELLGFPLCSPFDLLADDSAYCDDVVKARFHRHLGKVVHILGYYVCRKEVRTVNGQLMAFGTWLDRDGHFFDTVHFPNFLSRHPFSGKGVYCIEGKITEEFGFFSLEVIGLKRLPFRKDERFE